MKVGIVQTHQSLDKKPHIWSVYEGLEYSSMELVKHFWSKESAVSMANELAPSEIKYFRTKEKMNAYGRTTFK